MFITRLALGVALSVAAISLTTAPASAADLAAGAQCGQAPAGLTDAAKLSGMDAQCSSKTCAPGPTLKAEESGPWFCLAEAKTCAWPDGEGFADGDLKYSMAHRKLLRCRPKADGRAYFTLSPR